MTITPVKNGAGDVTHFIAIKLDITERKRAEERICRLAQAVENSAELIAIADPDGRISLPTMLCFRPLGTRKPKLLESSLERRSSRATIRRLSMKKFEPVRSFGGVDGEANASAAARMIATFPYS